MNVFIERKTIHGHIHAIKCYKQTLSLIQNGKQDLITKISKSHECLLMFMILFKWIYKTKIIKYGAMSNYRLLFGRSLMIGGMCTTLY
jgi:hypothetical protein